MTKEIAREMKKRNFKLRPKPKRKPKHVPVAVVPVEVEVDLEKGEGENKGEDKVPCRELARTKALWQYSLVAAAAASAAVICGK